MQSNQDQNKVSGGSLQEKATRWWFLLPPQVRQEEKEVKKGIEKGTEYSLEDEKSEMEIIENWVPESQELKEKDELKEFRLLQSGSELVELKDSHLALLKMVTQLAIKFHCQSETQKELNYLQLQMLERMSEGLMLVTAMACLSSLSVLGLWARG